MKITADHSIDSYTATRLTELEEEIPRIDKAMADVRHSIEKFVESHPQQRTTFSNGLPAVRVGAMELRHPDLRELETALDNLVLRWHATLAEFANVKAKVPRGSLTVENRDS